MTDQSHDDAPPGGGNGRSAEHGLAKLMEGLTADELFGTPRQVGNRTIITAVAVERAGGFGFGSGEGSGTEGDTGRGGGGGGGGRAEGRPVAVVEIAPDGVMVRPVVDFTRIWVTVVLALLSLRGLRRRRK